MEKLIGHNIRLLRERLGLSQIDLANYLGLERRQIIRYESGDPVPTSRLTKLAELFAIDESDFYEENPSMINMNLAFAFRANKLDTEDLKTIASFKKIAMNYLKMKEVLKDE